MIIDRIIQARELRGLTQTQLAEQLNIPQAVLSMYEIGARRIPNDLLAQIADRLSVPLDFFDRSPVTLPEGSLGLFRSQRTKVKTAEVRKARRYGELAIEAITRLAGDARAPRSKLEAIPGCSPDSLALYARNALRLAPDAPIRNLTHSLECAGAYVLVFPDLECPIDGFSAWLPKPHDRPFLAACVTNNLYRRRFTLAHELGHLLNGHQPFNGPERNAEDEANAFAQAFLMPEDPIREDFEVPLSLPRLAELKGKWGVSMMALAMRAQTLGVVDKAKFTSLYQSMRVKGWVKREPGDADSHAEFPTLMKELMKANAVELSVFALAERLDYSAQDARAIFGDADELVLKS